MHAGARDMRVARRLATIAVERSDLGVSGVVELVKKILAGRTLRERRKFVKTFLYFFHREIRRHELIIEFVGKLSAETEEAIFKSFEEKSGRTLSVVRRENEKLIGGIRVILEDMVFDASVAGKLAMLSQGVK